MLTKLILNEGGLSRPYFEADGTDATTVSGGEAAASATSPAGASQDVTTAIVAPDAAAAETPPPEDWRVRRIAELTGQGSKYKQRIAELEQQIAASAVKETPAGQKGRTYTDAEFQSAVREHASNLSAVELFDAKCNDTAQKGMKTYSDFQQKLDTLKAATVLDPVFLEQAWEIGNAHDILYTLGKDPARAQEIMAMKPTARAVALAKMTIELDKAPKVPSISAAPPPNPTSVGAISGGTTPLEGITNMDDWVKQREKDLADRRAAGRRR